jgi:hypothetical protein
MADELRAERCQTCRFRYGLMRLDPDGRWRPRHVLKDHPDGLTEREYEDVRDDTSGECRRYPPVTTDGRFPDVRLDDWCGEYQPQPADTGRDPRAAFDPVPGKPPPLWPEKVVSPA